VNRPQSVRSGFSFLFAFLPATGAPIHRENQRRSSLGESGSILSNPSKTQAFLPFEPNIRNIIGRWVVGKKALCPADNWPSYSYFSVNYPGCVVFSGPANRIDYAISNP
jgi:hypothetical protein